MKYRHAADYRLREVHDQIDSPTIWNIDSVEPLRRRQANSIHRVDKEMHLVNVKWMEFGGAIDNAPVLHGPDAHSEHRRGIHRELFAVDVEPVFVFCEQDREVGRARLQLLQFMSRELSINWRAYCGRDP